MKYQILGGRLYRDEKCYFPPRCAGIEHFLLEIAPELPDLEYLVNVQDHPATRVDRPLPVFSFSKIPAEHADILYPAWAFWEGGPAFGVIPTWRWDLTRRDLLAAGPQKSLAPFRAPSARRARRRAASDRLRASRIREATRLSGCRDPGSSGG